MGGTGARRRKLSKLISWYTSWYKTKSRNQNTKLKKKSLRDRKKVRNSKKS